MTPGAGPPEGPPPLQLLRIPDLIDARGVRGDDLVPVALGGAARHPNDEVREGVGVLSVGDHFVGDAFHEADVEALQQAAGLRSLLSALGWGGGKGGKGGEGS